VLSYDGVADIFGIIIAPIVIDQFVGREDSSLISVCSD